MLQRTRLAEPAADRLFPGGDHIEAGGHLNAGGRLDAGGWPDSLPTEPRTVDETGLAEDTLRGLVLKYILASGSATPREIADVLCLSPRVIDEVMAPLKHERLVQISGSASQGEQWFNYLLTASGRDQAVTAAERNGYVGPAPVSWAQYAALLERQSVHAMRVPRPAVARALSGLVLSSPLIDTIGVAVNSSHSILFSGAPGNGKTSITRAMRDMLEGRVLVPYAVEVGHQTITIFDPRVHEPLTEDLPAYDRRYVACRRPIVTLGGELVLEDLELQWDEANRCYNAPPPLKANGGILVVDDFGRQRVRPSELLNRWITPLEAGWDQLRMRTEGTIRVPFDVLVVFSSNRAPAELGDEAFLRRIRYKIHVPDPTREEFVELMHRASAAVGLVDDPDVTVAFMRREYEEAEREYRGCHPTDIIRILLDCAAYRGERARLSVEALAEAASIYFVARTSRPDHVLPWREAMS
ncbi:MAG: ATP-binding protein [Dehalococcoidia bacterium]